MKILNKEFFLQSPEIVAPYLIGKEFVRILDNGQKLTGIITETEAYLSHDDESSHSFKGLTKRNAPMFAEGGVLYVYFIYGVHHCINFVTEPEGIGSAVLIRKISPREGIETMKINRARNIPKDKLCSGPGNIAKAFGFGLAHNFLSICSDSCHILDNDSKQNIITSTRIGISKSKELPLRFHI